MTRNLEARAFDGGRMTTGRRSLLLLAALVILAGCARGTGERMEAAEVGLTVAVPRGWRVDPRNPRLCFKGEATGLIIDEPLEGRTFRDAVEQSQRIDGGSVIASTPMRIGASLATLEIR